MAAIWHNGNWYGGGTDVEANPSGTATDTLTKVGIDGTVYSIASSSSQVQSDWTQTDTSAVDFIKNKPTLGTASAKDVPTSGDATTSQVVVGTDSRLTNARNAADVSAWAKEATKPTYTASEVGLGNVPNVTTDNQTPTVTEASTRSNLASGDTLKTIISKIKKFFTDLKTVAFTGSYTDLTDKPTIPAAQVNADWTASSGVAEILHKPSLATVATSGSYTDLSNTPTIPAAQVNSDWNASSGVAQILNKPTIPAAQIQSDWNQTDTSAKDYIKNKPTIPSGGVTGVKGESESTYRTGNVNITAANVGALPTSGGTMVGEITLSDLASGIVPATDGGAYIGTSNKRIESINANAVYSKMFALVSSNSYGSIYPPSSGLTANRTLRIPDESGTLLTKEGSNLVTIHYHSGTQTTGSSGNIATGYTADGKTFLCGAYVTNVACCMRMWVSNSNSKWYLTAINPNTGATLNNTSVAYKYFAVILNSAS